MSTEYSVSVEGGKVAKELIKSHFSDLARIQIVYIFQQRLDPETGQPMEIKQKGKPLYATVKVVSGLNAFLVGGESKSEGAAFYVVLISKVWWDRFTADGKKACMHQQLCKMFVNDGVLSLVDFDVREFNEVAKIYGPWEESIAAFLEVTAQMKLPIATPEPAEKKGLGSTKTDRKGLAAVPAG